MSEACVMESLYTLGNPLSQVKMPRCTTLRLVWQAMHCPACRAILHGLAICFHCPSRQAASSASSPLSRPTYRTPRQPWHIPSTCPRTGCRGNNGIPLPTQGASAGNHLRYLPTISWERFVGKAWQENSATSHSPRDKPPYRSSTETRREPRRKPTDTAWNLRIRPP